MIRIATVFSGIGAAEQALQQLGIEHEIVFACDNGERYLKQSFEEITGILDNFSGVYREQVLQLLYNSTGKPNNVKRSYFANYDIDESRWFEDIRFVDGKPHKGQVDLFVGGSPCQSFSTYGHKRGLEDTRGTLFYDYARLVQEIQPKAFIFENVTGLLTHDHGRTWQVIKDTFDLLNYDIKLEVLNAQDYNLPQLRKRVFVVGIITYGDNIICNLRKAENIQYVYNAFILPYNKHNNKFGYTEDLEYVGYSEANWRNDGLSHTRICAFLIDTKHLISAWAQGNCEADIQKLIFEIEKATK